MKLAACAVAALYIFASCGFCDSSTNTYTTPVVSTVTVHPESDEGGAISTLNYKIEYMQSRYNSLLNDMDDLRTKLKDVKRIVAEQGQNQVNVKRIVEIDMELAVIRSEIAQMRQDISKISATPPEAAVPDEKDIKTKILKSPWLPVSAVVIAVISLLVHH